MEKFQFNFKIKTLVAVADRAFDIDGTNAENITAITTINFLKEDAVSTKVNTPPSAARVIGIKREQLNILQTALYNAGQDWGYETLKEMRPNGLESQLSLDLDDDTE